MFLVICHVIGVCNKSPMGRVVECNAIMQFVLCKQSIRNCIWWKIYFTVILMFDFIGSPFFKCTIKR